MKILIILVVLFLLFLIFSEWNTRRVNFVNVHNFYGAESAPVLLEIDRRLKILQKHMNAKYPTSTPESEYFDMPERVRQFQRNYNSSNLYEISPNNLLRNTSFTEGKGSKIVMCIRNPEGQLHDMNTIMFVALHEITHVMNDRWGHERYFWKLFQVVLHDAVECGIYQPQNYEKQAKSYCGIQITQNPLYGI